MNKINKLIRVLHVLGSLDQGGAESRIMDIYRVIDRSVFQFDFIIHTYEDCYFTAEVEELGGRVFIVPRFNGNNYFEYKKAWSVFFELHPEYKIIHGHITSTAFIYLKLAKKFKLPLRIAHSRSASKSSIVRRFTSKLSKKYATHLFAVSKLAAISEFGKKLVEKNKVSIIPNAIDVSKYIYNLGIRDKVVKHLTLEGKIVLGHIGSFRYPKNHDFLIDVFHEVKKIKNEAVLLLVGSGELQNNIRIKVNELNIQDSVIFLGNRSDVSELLQVMDLLLFPSIYEGLPGVVLEAQAAGLPCVISDSITKEVKITELVNYISLDKPLTYWTKTIIDSIENTTRVNTFASFIENGYDIESVVSWYEDFYVKKI